jgi:AraC-like DNA-binding protein
VLSEKILMILYIALTGLILSSILLYFNARTYRSALYLGLFFFLISLYTVIFETIFYSRSVKLISIVYLHFGFPTYLIGPALYFYIRSLLRDNPALRWRDLLHLIPSLVFLITTIPYFFTPSSYKLEIARQIEHNIGFIGQIKPTVLYHIFPAELIYLSRPFHLLIYLFCSVGMLIRYLFRNPGTMVLRHQRYMTKWLTLLLSFTLIMATAHLLQIHEAFLFRSREMFYTVNILSVIAAAGLTGLILSPFFFPAILYGLPRVPLPATQSEKNNIPFTNAAHDRKPDAVVHPDSHHLRGTSTPTSHPDETPGSRLIQPVSGFESTYLITIGEKVEACMREQSPYLHPECNLAFLSRLINIPAHHLAYFFREIQRQPFNDYRNEWRIGHAKKLILEGKAKEMTMEAIGFSSGFSSRITFNNAFKKSEGFPPGCYAGKVASRADHDTGLV